MYRREIHVFEDFVFSSTSSVYGLSENMPFKEDEPIDTPISIYSATKRAGELLCHAYNNLYGIRFRVMRFFTVYGPWGRPDMAYYIFTEKIQSDVPIQVYNNGELKRDFTYIDDIVKGIRCSMDRKSSFSIYNLGNKNYSENKTCEIIDAVKFSGTK